MKRLLPLLLVFALAGCDDESVTTTATPDSGTPAAQPTEQSPQAQPSQPQQPQGSQQPQAATLVEPGRSCADFQFYKAGQNLGSSATVDPIALSTADQSPIEVYDPASDIGLAGAMSVRIKGRLNITTEEPHAKFEISYISGGDTPIRLDVYAADGSVAQTQYLLPDPVHTVLIQPIDEPGGSKSLSLSEGGDQGALSRVCILQ